MDRVCALGVGRSNVRSDAGDGLKIHHCYFSSVQTDAVNRGRMGLRPSNAVDDVQTSTDGVRRRATDVDGVSLNATKNLAFLRPSPAFERRRR